MYMNVQQANTYVMSLFRVHADNYQLPSLAILRENFLKEVWKLRRTAAQRRGSLKLHLVGRRRLLRQVRGWDPKRTDT